MTTPDVMVVTKPLHWWFYELVLPYCTDSDILVILLLTNVLIFSRFG